MKNLKYILLVLFLPIFEACEKEEVHMYLGKDYVQFTNPDEGNLQEEVVFSFAYSPDDFVRDTIWLPAHISGDIYPHKRYYKLRQAVDYYYDREYDVDGTLINSTLLETPNQAVAGVHYVPFDDPDYLKMCYVDSNKVELNVPVILLRDISLEDVNKLLSIEFIESDDFGVGDYELKKRKVSISDNVSYPENWPEDEPSQNNKYRSLIFGVYGPVKHRFMIQVTGMPWDNDFMKALTYEERLIYKHKCVEALNKINEERANNGQPPLMEDPSFVYGPVQFV